MIEGGLNVEVVRRIAASPATVFSYLVEPAKFTAWMGVGAELDPRPGGRVRIDVDGEHFATGEFREVDPPHRVVMTWGWESNDAVPPGSTTVEITLTPDGGVRFYSSNILVGPPDGESASLLPLSKIDEIKQVEGVAAAFPGYQFSAKP